MCNHSVCDPSKRGRSQLTKYNTASQGAMSYTLTKQTFARISAAAAAAVLVLLTACDPNRPRDDLSKRIEMDGYSFFPPAESGWGIAARSPERIALLKAGGMEGQSYLIQANQLPLDGLSGSDGLVAFTEETHKNEYPQPRFRILEQDMSSLQIAGADCAMSHILVEDRDPGSGSNVVSAVLIESVGTICIHPSRAGLGVAMTYQHRSFPEDRDRGFEGLASSILQTQQFSGSSRPDDS